MDQNKNDAAVSEAEPDERERQKRNRGQGIEHGGEGFEKIGANSSGAGERCQKRREREPDDVTLEQHRDGVSRGAREFRRRQSR